MEFVKVQKLSYIGNKQTNKYKNNVQLYVQPYFTDKDIITFIDLKEKKETREKVVKKVEFKKLSVSKMKMGKYTYYRFLSSQLSKHTGQYCLLMNISKAVNEDIVRRSAGRLDRYLLVSNDTKKEPLLIIILNAKFRELLYYE